MTASLIERVEAAERGSLVLDGEIWCVVNGYEFVQWDGAGCVYRHKPGGNIGHESHTAIRPYSVSLDAALALAERALPGWVWNMGNDMPCWVHLWIDDRNYDGIPIKGDARTAPLALCAAILRAHEASK